MAAYTKRAADPDSLRWFWSMTVSTERRHRLAAKNKCLADSNKTRTGGKATNEQSASSAPPSVQIGAASAMICRADEVPLLRRTLRRTAQHATHEFEGNCARCEPARRYQDAISHARPARTADANRHLHGLLHRTRGTPPARGAPTAALIARNTSSLFARNEPSNDLLTPPALLDHAAQSGTRDFGFRPALHRRPTM